MKTLSPEIKAKYGWLNPNDVVFTPELIAEKIVSMFPISGRVLEPCKGEGAFLKYLPEGQTHSFQYIDPIAQIFMDFYSDTHMENLRGETKLIIYQDWADKARKVMSEEINARYDLVLKDELFAFEEKGKKEDEDIDKEIDEIIDHIKGE